MKAVKTYFVCLMIGSSPFLLWPRERRVYAFVLAFVFLAAQILAAYLKLYGWPL